MFDLEKFIDRYVTHRNGSMFAQDIEEHKNELQAAIGGKGVLVIGGAGSIGSSFIRAILSFKPAELVVVGLYGILTSVSGVAGLMLLSFPELNWCRLQ